ncbi:MAG: lamin tail domain-containing protein [Candidatus Kapaibacterium sp.]
MKKLTQILLSVILVVLFTNTGWGQVNITPIRTDVSGFSDWTDNSVAGTTYLQLLVAGASTTSPAMNFDSYSSEALNFKARTFGGANATENVVTVSISTNNGSDWTVLGTRTPTSTTLTAMTAFDLSSYNGTQVKVKFSVAGTNNSIGAGIDDLTITGTSAGPTLPTVTTNASITSNGILTATWGGEVTADGGASVTNKGLVWNTSTSPTTANSKTEEGTGTGLITGSMTGLTPNTLYYVRAYAINSVGTAYGTEKSFTTNSLGAPVSTNATGLTTSSFTANWGAVTGATSYRLDVSEYNNFSTATNATDLFISEYVEGSSNNKYIEIYNGTGSSVDLSNYKLQLYANGSATATNDVTLSGTLANGQAFVYKNSGATLTLPNGVTASDNAAVNFNGDDAIVLYKISTDSYVDIFGRIGNDPGTAWTGNGGYTTVDKTLRRKSNITQGITVNPTGTGATAFTTLTTEWDMYDTDVATNLGSHTYGSESYVTGYNNLTVNPTSQEVTGLNANTTYYYRIRAYSSTSTSSNSDVITVTTLNTAPVTQASNITFSNLSATEMTISWTNGTGDNRAVFVKEGDAGSPTPSDNYTYTASANWNSGSPSGTQIGLSGYYCVYNSSGTNAAITGLNANSHYQVIIFEYNNSSGNERYHTSGTANSTGILNVTNATNLATGTYNHVHINNGSGVTLSGDVTINSSLTLTSGILHTSDDYTLTLGENVSNPTETETSYINGTIVIIKNVGTNAFHFFGCNISAGADIGTLTFTRKTGSSGASTINTYNSIAESWQFSTTTPGSREVTLRWYFSFRDNGNNFSTEKTAQLYKYTDSWSKAGNGEVIAANTRTYTETLALSSTSTKYSVAVPSSVTMYSQNFNTDNWTGTNSSQPDANWTNTPTTGNTSWRLNNQSSTNNSASWAYPLAGRIKSYGNSGYSAQFHTYGATNASSGTLDLKMDFSTVGTKELSFYYTNATGSDILEVFFSTDNGASFSSALGTYTTGSWEKKTISLGTSTNQECIIRFKATSDFGRDDIGIDNVEVNVVRYSYTVDPGMLTIDMNANYNTGTFAPQATVKNYGTSTLSTFDVTMTITGGYSSTKTVTNLAANGESQVTFNDWSPTAGSYTVSVSTTLTSDQNTANNTSTKSVGVSSGTWSEGNVIPSASYLGSAVSYVNGGNKLLYVTGGVGTENKFYKYNAGTNVWFTLPDITSGKTVHASAIVNGYLYVIGGANSGAYQSTVYRFDLSNESGSWEPMASIGKTIGWCKAAAYGQYIYLVGGFTNEGGSQALGDVYVYNTETDTWSAGTSLNDSKKRFGGALSITGNKLVYVAGASSSSTLTDEVLIGEITGATTISWSVSSSPFPGNGGEVIIPSDINLASLDFPRKNSKIDSNGDEPMSVFPAGALYCLDAAPWGDNSIIIAGGTDGADGNPTDPNLCYAFNPTTNIWSPKQNVPTPVYGSGLGTVSDETNWYLILASGWTTNSTTNKTQIFTVASSGGQPQSILITSLLEGRNITDNPPQTYVTIELRNSSMPYSLADSKLIVQNETGLGTAVFNNIDASKAYYIVIRYENGLETWSAQPQFFVNGQMSYDFTSAQTQAFGNNMVNVNGKWCVISGDIDQDGKINAMDRGICWNDRGTNDEYSDLNHDGVVNDLDRVILVKNKNISVKRPEGAVQSMLKIGKQVMKSSNKVTK